ncbi:MAG: TolC family protein, partial [Bdellovibrionales bacterium]|nr:TolC family protein [Bdellovibrionales bacterium]
GLLAVIIIYIVLASQFESLVHPITVMLALPMGLFGGLGGLWIFSLINALGESFYGWAHYSPDPPLVARVLDFIVPRIPSMTINLFSIIGMLLLFGLVTKNSILLVDFAKRAREEGMEAEAAMLQAAKIRLRPILMTALATIIGIMPIAFGVGAGAESRRPMGIVVVCGMTVSTFLTLYIVPVFYCLLDVYLSKETLRKVRQKIFSRSVVTRGLLVLALGLLALQNVSAQDDLSKLEKDVVVLVSDATKRDDLKDYATLTDCLAIALEKNFSLRAAKQQVEKQRGVKLSLRSESLPQLGAVATYEQVDKDKLTSFGGNTFGTEKNWNANLELSQKLFAGGRLSAERAQGRLLLEAAQLEFNAAINNVLRNVKIAFFDVLLSRARIDVHDQSVKLLEQELEQERNKLSAGTVSDFNVLRAEVELANARTPLIRARNDLRLSLEELSNQLGLPHRDPSVVAPALKIVGELVFEDNVLDLAKALSEAYQHRPELKRLKAIKKASDEGIRISRSEYFPELLVYAGYGAEKSRFEDSLDEIDHGWQAGVRTSWNFFSGQNTTGKIIQARADREIAQIAEEEMRQQVEIEVRTALSRLVEAKELVLAASKVVEQADESFRLAKARLDAGSARQIDVLDTQVALTEARTNKIEALYAFNISQAELRKAIGAIQE